MPLWGQLGEVPKAEGASAPDDMVSEDLRMMLPSFFTKETGGYFIMFRIHYTEYWQAYEPYKAMASLLPLRTLVIGHNDLSTGGVSDTTPMSTLF